MGKGEKRSLEQMEGGSSVDVDAYVLSESERLSLEESGCPTFSDFSAHNSNLNTATKMAALKVDQSIVPLVSFSGTVMLTQSCGTIIENVDNVHTVITSLSLIRKPTKARVLENSLAQNLKVIVNCQNEKSYIGEIETYDFHYNILFIKFKSMTSFLTANLKLTNDVNIERSFLLRPHAPKNDFEDSYIVVGRYFYEPFGLMAAPGELSKDRVRLSYYDCHELITSTCNITECGDGSPLINLTGDVIGIAYYFLGAASPILPIDVAYRWWSHFKKFNESRHPSYGLIASNIFSARLSTLARLLKKFPRIYDGLIVDTVQPRSNADTAGLHKDDVIIKCDGKFVRSFVELWSVMWEKVGDIVELEVGRIGNCSTMNVSMVVGEATPTELNKWNREK